MNMIYEPPRDLSYEQQWALETAYFALARRARYNVEDGLRSTARSTALVARRLVAAFGVRRDGGKSPFKMEVEA